MSSHLNVPIFHPITMELLPHEVQRAQAIKAAVEADAKLQNLPDFDYVQFALANPAYETSLETVIDQVKGLQAFKAEYKIQDTLNEASSCLAGFMLDHPGVLVHVTYLGKNAGGNCAMIFDWSAFHPRKIQTLQHREVFFKGMYYVLHSGLPTFCAMRQGISLLVECKEASSENVEYDFHLECIHQLLRNYPMRQREVYALNAPIDIVVLCGLCKRYMSENFRNVFRLDEVVPRHAFDAYYHTPTPMVARLRCVLNASELIMIRMFHQANFSLPTMATVTN